MENKKPGVGVGIMILRDNKVLLGKRHEDPDKADSELHGEGTWTMPGGKLHFGETLEDAVFREILEETGAEINKGDLKLVSITNDIVEDAHFVTMGFLCKNFQEEPKVMEPDEITEWKWFSLDDLPTPVFSPSEKILKNYLARQIYKN